MRVFRGVLPFMVASILGSGSTLASQTNFTIMVQNYRALPPYSTYDKGEYGGFNRELLDMFAKEKGYTFEYVAYPVKRLFFEFVNGAGDFKYPDNPKWASKIKKNAPIIYSDPVVEYIDGVMVLPQNKGRDVKSLKTLGLVAGWTPFQYLPRVKSGDIKIQENNAYGGLLKQTILGRNDGAYSNIASSRYYLNNIVKQPGSLVFDDTLPHVRSGRTLSSIKYPEIIAEFNTFLKERADVISALKIKLAVEDGVK